MTAESSEHSKAELLGEIEDLMLHAQIRPEPQYRFCSRYLAAESRKENLFQDGDEILNLVDTHGVQLLNDVRYWIDKSKIDNSTDSNKGLIPVINPEHFEIQDFNALLQKLAELPSDWTLLQITKKFSLGDVTRKNEVPEMYLTRFSCGDLAKRLHPYSIVTEDNSNFQQHVFKVLQDLIVTRKEFYNLGRTCKKLCQDFYKTNSELENFIKELELYVLGPWLCLFQGRLEDAKLEKETLAQITKLVTTFCQREEVETMPNEKQIDVIYQLALSAHLLKDKALFHALRSVLYTGDKSLVNVGELMMLVENIKILNLSNGCALKRARRKPLILILDNEFEIVPWEMVAALAGHPACRISSLHLLYALYKYHEPYIINGYRVIEIDQTYCLINPDEDLKECEKEMKEFLEKRAPWAELEIGRAPDPKDLLSKIGNCSAYLFCGHGSGIQYLKAKDLRKAFVRGLLLLFGCASNIPKNCGGRTPFQNCTYTYITNGCPCVIGCIQDLGSKDADDACKEILSNILPAISVEGAKKVVLEPNQPDVLEALASGRFACPRYWSKSAFAARGLPCKTAVGDVKSFF